MNFKLLKNKGKISKNKQEKSRGRSMVEMLGVLAIIGVLSIGGISGYTIAMRRYRANEILNYLNKVAFIAYEQIQAKILNGSDVSISSSSTYFNSHMEYYFQCGNKMCLSENISDFGVGALPSGLDSVYLDDIFISDENQIVVVFWGSFSDSSICQHVYQSLPDIWHSDSIDNGCPDGGSSLRFGIGVDEADMSND